MKTTIQIESIFGNLLFEFEKEDNSIRDTLIEAVNSGANLSGANLSGANLCRADLYGADLSGADLYGANLCRADLYGADLSGANLCGANLFGANLCRADLSGANLCGANLSGANLSGVKIKKAIVFSGLYKYVVIPFISEDGEKYVKMGCFVRKVSEWDADFWNNKSEFFDHDSEESKLRVFAYETAKRWFDVIDIKS